MLKVFEMQAKVALKNPPRYRRERAILLIYRTCSVNSEREMECDVENDIAELDQMQDAYEAAVNEWIDAINIEEALASVNHSVADVDKWETAYLREEEIRSKVKAAKKRYEDTLRKKSSHSSWAPNRSETRCGVCSMLGARAAQFAANLPWMGRQTWTEVTAAA